MMNKIKNVITDVNFPEITEVSFPLLV